MCMYFGPYMLQVLTGPNPETHTIAVDNELHIDRLPNRRSRM
jgi:hypothetical protein